MSQSSLLQAFSSLWSDLFSSPVHLDSAISKRPRHQKSLLAQIAPPVLLRPASTAQQLGVGIPMGEPWTLDGAAKAKWRPATLMAERLHSGMSQGLPTADPLNEDFPPAMIEAWEKDFGKEVAKNLVRELGREAPMSLRAVRKTGAKELLEGMSSGSRLPVKAELSDISPLGIRFAGYAPVMSSDWGSGWHEQGAFEIQDEGSQLMAFFALWPELFAEYLTKEPGPVVRGKKKVPTLPVEVPAWTIIDACAGAGGKSLAIADALRGKGRVYAYDTSPKKLQALRRRATRAGVTNIQSVVLKEGDEATSLNRFKKSANVVLVDAPCTGWGVLRRNPDIKWRQGTDSLERMPEIQNRLLSLYSALVAPGGRLVFGVCTFRKAETKDVVETFLAKHPEFKAVQGGYLGPGPCDGFFMQAFERSKD